MVTNSHHNSPQGTSHGPFRIAALVFLILWSIAMWLYPGWNSFDANSPRHEFSRNFLCDLLSGTTPDGRSNIAGSAAMNLGVVVLVVGGLLPLWWRVEIGEPWARMSRLLGAGAAILTLAICAEQAFGLSISHNVITLAAGAAGIVPTAIVAVVDWRSPEATLARRALLVGTISASLVNFVSYSLVQLGGELTALVPSSQKAALLCLLAWLLLNPRVARQVIPTEPSH